MKWLDAVIDFLIYLVVAFGLAALILLGSGCAHAPPGIKYNHVGFYPVPEETPSKLGNYVLGGKHYSNSMAPTIMPGEPVAYDEEYPYAFIQAGDIVVFNRESGDPPVIHRTLRQTEQGEWITKGDNNRQPDLFTMNRTNYVGKVVAYGKVIEKQYDYD